MWNLSPCLIWIANTGFNCWKDIISVISTYNGAKSCRSVQVNMSLSGFMTGNVTNHFSIVMKLVVLLLLQLKWLRFFWLQSFHICDFLWLGFFLFRAVITDHWLTFGMKIFLWSFCLIRVKISIVSLQDSVNEQLRYMFHVFVASSSFSFLWRDLFIYMTVYKIHFFFCCRWMTVSVIWIAVHYRHNSMDVNGKCNHL